MGMFMLMMMLLMVWLWHGYGTVWLWHGYGYDHGYGCGYGYGYGIVVSPLAKGRAAQRQGPRSDKGGDEQQGQTTPLALVSNLTHFSVCYSSHAL